MTANLDLDSLERRIRRLEDIESIKSVIARYAQGADRRNDPAILGPLFAADAIWEAAGFGRFEGRDIIAQSLATIARERILWSVHFMVLPTVTISAEQNTASCTWSLWELAKIREDRERVRDTWLAIKYDGILVKHSSGWIFDSLKLHFLLNSPVGEPWPMPD